MGAAQGHNESAKLQVGEIRTPRLATPPAGGIEPGVPGQGIADAPPGHADRRGEFLPGHRPALIKGVEDLDAADGDVLRPAALAGELPHPLAAERRQVREAGPAELAAGRGRNAGPPPRGKGVRRQSQPPPRDADRAAVDRGPLLAIGGGDLGVAPAGRVLRAEERLQVRPVDRAQRRAAAGPARGIVDLEEREPEPLGAPGGAAAAVVLGEPAEFAGRPEVSFCPRPCHALSFQLSAAIPNPRGASIPRGPSAPWRRSAARRAESTPRQNTRGPRCTRGPKSAGGSRA